MMKYSVSLCAEGDREITLEEVLELADAVAPLSGIAAGMGTMSYGAQIVVEAENNTEAVALGIKQFEDAVAQTSLPVWPLTKAESLSEDDDFPDLEDYDA